MTHEASPTGKTPAHASRSSRRRMQSGAVSASALRASSTPCRGQAIEGRGFSSPETGGRLALAMLAYMLGVTLIITLLPFQFDWPSRWRIMFTGGPVDIIANVLLFLPLGFLFRLARRERVRHSALTVLWIGALVSMAIESAQLFERERYASVLDVATNGLGAWLGALAYDRLAPRTKVDGLLIGRLSLELPLMGLLYLMVPLLWLNALASGAAMERSMLSLLLGVFGASVLGGIQRHHFGPVRSFDARASAGAAAAWFVAGTFPALPNHPGMVLSGTLLVGALAWWNGTRSLARVGAHSGADGRRFEVPLLTAAAPAYAAYLLLLTLAPLLQGIATWQVGVTFPGVAAEWTKTEILRFLEQVAAFTLLGYMAAEFRGRSLDTYRLALPRLLTLGVAATLLGEGIRGLHEGHGASIARGGVLLAATLYGGWLYYLQRAHVTELLAERRAVPDSSDGSAERIDAA